MLLKLYQVGEAVLREQAHELTPDEIRSEETQALIELMHATLRDAPGVGLAAPQIGQPIQLAIIEDLPEYSRNLTAEQLVERERKPVPFQVIINPRITPVGEPTIHFFEGCLSLTGYTAVVPRYRRVRVECLDEYAQPRVIEATGWYARILQHEIDHLHGTLYIDRMLPRSFMSLENLTRYWKDASMDRLRSELRLP